MTSYRYIYKAEREEIYYLFWVGNEKNTALEVKKYTFSCIWSII